MDKTLSQRALYEWAWTPDDDGDTPSDIDWDTYKDAWTDGWEQGYLAAQRDAEDQG